MAYDAAGSSSVTDKGGDDKKQKKGGKKDWEEFYDNQAKAKYWFNKKTGEASWINPYQ
ncbi:hypothetical protein EON64_08890 [archaeon]|nr:MAG: hypothetical protein EON64_08890 [archaeon]